VLSVLGLTAGFVLASPSVLRSHLQAQSQWLSGQGAVGQPLPPSPPPPPKDPL
jgi:hypothetical protein